MPHLLGNKRIRRLLLLGGLALMGGLLYWALPTIRELQGGDERITIKRKQLVKYHQRLAATQGLDQRVTAQERLLKRVEAGLLNAETPSLAAVDIQNLLGEIAGRSSVELRTVRVLSPEKLEDETYLGIPVQFTVRTQVAQLQDILYEIENTTKYLTVEKVRITVARSRNPGEIQSDITVRGYMRTSA